MNGLQEVLWMIGAVFLVGYLPGNFAVRAVFPNNKFDRLEKCFFSIVISFAISSLTAVGILLNRGVLEPFTFIPTLFLVIIIFLCISWYWKFSKRSQRVDTKPRRKIEAPVLDKMPPMSSPMVFLILVIIAVVANGAKYSIQDTPHGLTEFYISPDSYNALLEQNRVPGEEVQVPLEVMNREGKVMVYRVVAVSNELEVFFDQDITLESGKLWSGMVKLPAERAASLESLDLILYRGSSSEIVGQLKLWLAD